MVAGKAASEEVVTHEHAFSEAPDLEATSPIGRAAENTYAGLITELARALARGVEDRGAIAAAELAEVLSPFVGFRASNWSDQGARNRLFDGPVGAQPRPVRKGEDRGTSNIVLSAERPAPKGAAAAIEAGSDATGAREVGEGDPDTPVRRPTDPTRVPALGAGVQSGLFEELAAAVAEGVQHSVWLEQAVDRGCGGAACGSAAGGVRFVLASRSDRGSEL